ncbi:hypothetical protein P775_02230 [Puniceibacterium antarcticum]|uniref:Cytochrome c domain-containing protein n=1 Tax=Puniceibacterium antarcticum TaxID=1206336 RepID=A0A2G8RJY4_9RHOB|nr:c-type cytochrome [Puniceibacterium antarcticum]PIL21812.1 hypothetical protein P775_02230 [Puniceibacterium antarcticum]
MRFLICGTLAACLCAGAALSAPSVERGAYLVQGPAGCGSCHTPFGAEGFDVSKDLSGRLVDANPAFTAIAANITPASRILSWSDAELARAIREGIRPDGSLIGPPMPFAMYRGLGDDDLMSIVMYLRTVPPVENDPGASRYHINLPPAYGPPVSHVTAPQAGPTAEYGAYLASAVTHCMECHTPMGPRGPMIDTDAGRGGFEFHGPWGTSVASNLTSSADGLASYSDEEIKVMVTKGMRPDGSHMLPPMPYGYFARMSSDDLTAVVAYLRTLPALSDMD